MNRFVDDPPWIKADRANFKRLDYVGFGFLTIAMGGMQIMLDKGEENAWFASNSFESSPRYSRSAWLALSGANGGPKTHS